MGKKGHGLSLRQAADLFALLADEARFRLALALASRGEAHVEDLGEGKGISRPGVSYHLGLFRRGGLASVRRDGQHHYYRLTAPVVTDLLRLVCGPGLLENPK
jgi:DNA-binding transcriptional ArsR family regulator